MAIDTMRKVPVTTLPTLTCNVGPGSRFDKLVAELKLVLGPSSGLTSEDVDVAHLAKIMKEYNSKDNGWERYALGDASRGYTRNLVDEGNGKSNLVRLKRTSRLAIQCPILT